MTSADIRRSRNEAGTGHDYSGHGDARGGVSVVEYAGVPIRIAAVHDEPAPSVPDGRVDQDNPPGRVETWFETHPRMTAALTVFLFGVIPYGWLLVMDIMHGAGK
jgi:hypothetical protein